MRTRRGTALAALLLLASGCSSSAPEPQPLEAATSASSGGTVPDPGSVSPTAGLARFYEQELDWERCRDGAECTEVEVPLDYERPRGRTIEIAVMRVPAGDQADKVGALLVNPGGPGVSGVDYAAQASFHFGEPITDNFDIVGFDPRGVARSAPLDCVSDAQLDSYIASDPDPDSPAELAGSERIMRQFGEGCLERSGDLARHISTEAAARDLDIIRATLDQPKMLYFGASYGTVLGGTYADLFPDKVGRMVLDGAVDPTVSLLDLHLTQAKGFETALRAYVAHCVQSDGCPLEGSVDDGVRVIQDFLREVDRTPLPTSSDRELTQGHAVLGIWMPLYNRSLWSLLDAALADALRGDGTRLLQLADFYVSREAGGYQNNSMEALQAISCLDRDEWIEPRQLAAVEQRFVREAPTFGRIMAFLATGCGAWAVHSGERPEAFRAEGSAPILVIGTSRDPATPLVWAEGLAAQLDNAVLVRRDGDGHLAYNAGNECVDEVVESYLVSGQVPEETVDC